MIKKLSSFSYFLLQTMILNKHLTELMDGLTAKVFRTYNASITLQQQLDKLTDPDYGIPEKVRYKNSSIVMLFNLL